MRCSCADFGGAAERQFSEKRATKDLAQYRTKGPGSTTCLLLAGWATAGRLHGRLLDIGTGVGVLSFELLERGLTSAVGIDLSSRVRSVRASRRRPTTDQRSGRGLMRVKRRAPISCRHGCRPKEPLHSVCASGHVRGAVPPPFLSAGRDNFRDNLGNRSVPVTRSLSYT